MVRVLLTVSILPEVVGASGQTAPSIYDVYLAAKKYNE
jgi:hypothetical protein